MLIGRQAIVVGAGIGGLAAALALARRGASVTVLEQAEEVAEVGAGLQISPNGMAVLAALGLGPEMAEIGLPLSAVRLRNGLDGREVLGLDVAAAGFAHPWMLVHRADLISVLAAAADSAGVRIELKSPVAGLEEEGRTGIVLEDGRVLRGGVVVAADGVRSKLRPIVDPAPAPRFRGQVAWRALVPGDGSAAAEAEVFMGPGAHVVRYPLRGGRLINLVAVQERQAWAEEGWTHRGDPADMLKVFGGFAPGLRRDLERVESVHLWGLFRRPVARRWALGRVALLGDSAHATLPFLAQGAVMAIEDAWVLAETLSATDSVEAGLELYQRARRARCRRIVGAADRNAWAYHLRLPGFRQLAHLGLGLGEKLRPGGALARFDWLYRADVTEEV